MECRSNKVDDHLPCQIWGATCSFEISGANPKFDNPDPGAFKVELARDKIWVVHHCSNQFIAG